MEAVLAPCAPDQSVSPYKQIKNPRRNSGSFTNRRSENFRGGLLRAPPLSLFFSIPPSSSLVTHNYKSQPPLLPLPTSKAHHSLPSRSRGLSCAPTNRKINRPKDHSITTKKSKHSVSPKRQGSKIDLESSTTTATKEISDYSVVASINRLGPEPNDLPKDVSKVLLFSSSCNNLSVNSAVEVVKDLDMSSGSVFNLSPPPSCLPLPKFTLRPKLSCNAEASGVDVGATDNLRRMLRLR